MAQGCINGSSVSKPSAVAAAMRLRSLLMKVIDSPKIAPAVCALASWIAPRVRSGYPPTRARACASTRPSRGTTGNHQVFVFRMQQECVTQERYVGCGERAVAATPGQERVHLDNYHASDDDDMACCRSRHVPDPRRTHLTEIPFGQCTGIGEERAQ